MAARVTLRLLVFLMELIVQLSEVVNGNRHGLNVLKVNVCGTEDGSPAAWIQDSIYQHFIYQYSIYQYSIYQYSIYQYSIYQYSSYQYSIYQYSIYQHSVYQHSVY
ncbi:hypothetical protein PENARI_c039G07446 [Penicillium arizonense]|uniref:Uncharacterized protein n=1 Tax=Penicillium arizonense TaxID=1835702 RepID=A0A1F5L3A3_PENAI|nr:hypothetical protein PENARI_c039G07446 [Penicillium arizonense]OGE47662.1 hypothetical protein PENARI_c039G07446 [Penicillium arizonense]